MENADGILRTYLCSSFLLLNVGFDLRAFCVWYELSVEGIQRIFQRQLNAAAVFLQGVFQSAESVFVI